MTSSLRCIACGFSSAAPCYAGLLRCDRCGHTWANVDLSAEALQTLYGHRYFHGTEYTDYTADRQELEKNFTRRLQTLERFIDPRRHTRLFEIGCAYGFFLNLARSRFDAVEGIDVGPDAVRFAREQLRLPVLQGDLLAADLGHRQYDVVCMWDTIEHLATPDAYVEAVGRHMPAGALMAITTGDIASLNARIKRSRWRLIHPPTHVHYFSRRSLTLMLDRFGFDVVHLEYCGFYRSVGAMLDGVLRRRWGFEGVARRMQHTWLARRSLYLNLRDIMYVIATKRSV